MDLLSKGLGGLKIPGVDEAKKLAGQAGLQIPGGSTGQPPANPANPTPAGPVRDPSFFKDGNNLGKVYLIFLTLLPFIGSFGINLVAVDATVWGMAKATLQGTLSVGTKFLLKYYPTSTLVTVFAYIFSYLSPWYLYDIAQVFNPKFFDEGFKVPFIEKPIGIKGDEAYWNMKVLAAMLAAFSLAGLQILEWLPPQVTGAAKPWIQLGIALVGGLAAAGAGGIAGLPAMYNAYKTWKGTMSGGGSAQRGGGNAKQGPAQKGAGGRSDIPGNYTGSGIPSLREIASTMLGPNPAGDSFPYSSDKMSGGGGPSMEASVLGLGALAFITLGGISLALIRSKGEDGAKAE